MRWHAWQAHGQHAPSRRWSALRRAQEAASPPGPRDGTAAAARSLAGLFAGAGAVMVLVILVPHGSHFEDEAVSAGAAFAFVITTVVGALGGRTPSWALPPLLVTGIVAGSAVLVIGRGAPVVVASSSFYVAVTMYAFGFFTRLLAIADLIVTAVALGLVLGLNDDGAAPAEWLLFMATATAAGVVIWRGRRQLWRVAMTDALTGLPNRQSVDLTLEREIARAQRQGSSLSMMMVDLDAFKALNDRLGHAAGDAVLAGIARQWQSVLRDQDLLARYGGDEFVILLPGTGEAAACEVVERLRSSGCHPLSAGVATMVSSDAGSTLMARADSAMYEAKRSGPDLTARPPMLE